MLIELKFPIKEEEFIEDWIKTVENPNERVRLIAAEIIKALNFAYFKGVDDSRRKNI